MNAPISLFVIGKPVPKGRPRVVNGHAYTPTRTKDWERKVSIVAKSIMLDKQPLDTALRVELAFSGARANADMDNLAKAVLDAGNGVLWRDDHQIIDLHIMRIHGDPGVLIEVWEVDDVVP